MTFGKTLTRRAAIAAWAAVVGMTAGVLATPSQAQDDYPNRPITLIVPFGPGGSTDRLAQIVAPAAEKHLGQSIVIVHKPGAGTMLALNELVSATPDGYTISMANSTLVLQALYGKARYDYPNELMALGNFASSSHMFGTHPGTGWTTLADLVAAAKADPGGIKYGITGYGNSAHMGPEALALAAGINITPVSFDGGSAIAAAILGGHLDAASGSPVDYKEHVKAGTVIGLAYFGEERAKDPIIGQIPTAREQGYDFDLVTWQGLAGPMGMPEAVVAKIEHAFAQAMADPEVQEKILELGAEPAYMTAAEFQARWKRDGENWKRLVTETGILELIQSQ